MKVYRNAARTFALILLTTSMVLVGWWFSAPSARAAFGSSCAENPSWKGTNLAPCFADDANMDYCTPQSYPSGWGNQFGAAMNYLGSSTDMYATYAPVCGAQTDIGGYLDSSPEVWIAGTSIRGIALCTKPLGGWGTGVCDQGSLVAKSSLGTGGEFRKTMCHEIGHFTGLYHYDAPGAIAASCLVSGSSTVSIYSTTERGLINGRY